MPLTIKLKSKHSRVDIDVPAEKIHEVFSRTPHHICNMAPTHIQGCEIIQGEWGKEGSVICWNYLEDGVSKVAKAIVEVIDDANGKTTFKVIEGDIMNGLKSYKAIIHVSSKGEGCRVQWNLNYEKLNDDVADPPSLYLFSVQLIKDIASHLSKA